MPHGRPEAAVALAPVGPADLDELLAVNRASVDLHHPWVDAPRTRNAGADYLGRLADERTVGLLARYRPDGSVVGVINIGEIVRGAFLSAYLGYYANAALAGRGHMTQALALAIDHAFGPLALPPVGGQRPTGKPEITGTGTSAWLPKGGESRRAIS